LGTALKRHSSTAVGIRDGSPLRRAICSGVLERGRPGVGDAVAGGLVAGDDQEQEVVVEVLR
jgi:hypothetical protein